VVTAMAMAILITTHLFTIHRIMLIRQPSSHLQHRLSTYNKNSLNLSSRNPITGTIVRIRKATIHMLKIVQVAGYRFPHNHLHNNAVCDPGTHSALANSLTPPSFYELHLSSLLYFNARHTVLISTCS